MVWKEHFTNGRTFTAGSGLALMAAAFGAQITRWSHWITVGFGYGTGLVLLILSIALIAKSYYSPQNSPEPIIDIGALFPTHVQMENMKWRGQHDGVSAVVAYVRNLPSESPSKGGRATNLAASLSFTDSSGPQIFIEKAYWLDRLENWMDLSVGSHSLLLIGTGEDEFLKVCANRYEVDPRQTDDGKGMVHVAVRNALRFGEDLTVAIQIYSVETGKIFCTQSFVVPHGHEIANACKEKRTWKERILRAKKH